MTDQTILQRIHELAHEEEELWREAGEAGGLDGPGKQRLEIIGVELDQCYDLLRQRQAKREFGLSLHQIAEIWRNGSVVRSWLLDLTARALAYDETLASVAAYVPDSGEGRWTVFEAIDLDVSAPVITSALQRRLASRSDEPFSDKLLAALRGQFGGHAVARNG